MGPLVEDALKATRTIHRLIIAVSVVTLVFAFSLDLPTEKVSQRDAVGDLIASDFLSYDEFVARRVEVFSQENLKPIGDEVTARIENQGHLVFGLDDIGEALAKPIHVGKLLTNDLVFADMGSATLVSLHALNGLDLEADVQVLVPRTQDLLVEIEDFLRRESKTGLRVAEVRLTVSETSFTAQSFLPYDETNVGLYFELLDAVITGGVPAFSALFEADVVRIPETSFLHWVGNVRSRDNLVEVENGEVRFLPSLRNLPEGFSQKQLGPLHQELADGIARAGPEEQYATILGTRVPGLLVVLASPLALLALAYYFANHTGHLARLARMDAQSVGNFAWMPLAMTREFGLAGSRYRIVGWRLETFTSTVVLPVLALAIVTWKLSLFDRVDLWALGVSAVGVLGSVWFGLASIRNIAKARVSIETSNDEISPQTLDQP